MQQMVTYQEPQCRGPEVPRLYKGKSPGPSEKSAAMMRTSQPYFSSGGCRAVREGRGGCRAVREGREGERSEEGKVREKGGGEGYKDSVQLAANSLISSATFCSLS